MFLPNLAWVRHWWAVMLGVLIAMNYPLSVVLLSVSSAFTRCIHHDQTHPSWSPLVVIAWAGLCEKVRSVRGSTLPYQNRTHDRFKYLSLLVRFTILGILPSCVVLLGLRVITSPLFIQNLEFLHNFSLGQFVQALLGPGVHSKLWHAQLSGLKNCPTLLLTHLKQNFTN